MLIIIAMFLIQPYIVSGIHLPMTFRTSVIFSPDSRVEFVVIYFIAL